MCASGRQPPNTAEPARTFSRYQNRPVQSYGMLKRRKESVSCWHRLLCSDLHKIVKLDELPHHYPSARVLCGYSRLWTNSSGNWEGGARGALGRKVRQQVHQLTCELCQQYPTDLQALHTVLHSYQHFWSQTRTDSQRHAETDQVNRAASPNRKRGRPSPSGSPRPSRSANKNIKALATEVATGVVTLPSLSNEGSRRSEARDPQGSR